VDWLNSLSGYTVIDFFDQKNSIRVTNY